MLYVFEKWFHFSLAENKQMIFNMFIYLSKLSFKQNLTKSSKSDKIQIEKNFSPLLRNFSYNTFVSRIENEMELIMSKKTLLKPTDSELEILQILWQSGPATVKAVNEKLNEKKETGYTTTLKLLQIMYEKELVVRNEEERSHVYSAAIEEGDIQKALVDKLLESAFSGSAAKLVMQAIGNSQTSKEELEQIRAYLTEIEKGKK